MFATDLRPVVALFLRFGGLPEELDDAAVQQLDAWIANAQRVLQHHGGVLLELIMGDKGSYAGKKAALESAGVTVCPTPSIEAPINFGVGFR